MQTSTNPHMNELLKAQALIEAARKILLNLSGSNDRPLPAETPIESMDLPRSALSFLRNRGIKTARDLSRLTEQDLFRCYSLGPAKLAQIKESLSRLGLCLTG